VFDPNIVYEILYRQSVIRSLVSVYSNQYIVRHQNSCVRHHTIRIFIDIIVSRKSALQIYQEIISSLEFD